MVPNRRDLMLNHRITLAILILLGTLLLVIFPRPSMQDEDIFSKASSSGPSSRHQRQAEQETHSAKNGTRNRPAQPASTRVIASAGDQVVLKVYADRTFQLHLPDSTKDIFVPVGRDLFGDANDIPPGVKIKIRNSAGEIFTGHGGRGMQVYYGPEDHGWYRPGSGRIEMPVFSTVDPTTGEQTKVPGSGEPIEPLPDTSSARISPRGKLANMITGLSPGIRQQSGLEFKLAILPFALPNVRDSEGDRLQREYFPRHETGWLDGQLLFDDE
jgi:hypothetical protein